MRLLDSLRDDFTEHNPPLYLALGLLSLARRMAPDLGLAKGKAPPPPAASERAPDAPVADPFLLVLLGVVSLRRTLLSELDRIRAAQGAASPPGEAGTATPPLDLLR